MNFSFFSFNKIIYFFYKNLLYVYKTICNKEIIIYLALFQTPVLPTNTTTTSKNSTTAVTFPSASPRAHQQTTTLFPTVTQTTSPITPFATSHVHLTPLPCRSVSPVIPSATNIVAAPAATTTFRHTPSPNTPMTYSASHSPGVLQVQKKK